MNRKLAATAVILLAFLLIFSVPATAYADLPDRTPPVIIGVKSLTTTIDHAVSYMEGIFAYDETDGYVTVHVDNAAVDLAAEGVYQISYTAEDLSGNLATKVTTLTVSAPADDSRAEYFEFADQVLQEIITEDMTDYQKCCAVYDYVHRIPYVNKVYSEDWLENGYSMLTLRCGDCFGYYSASRLLLECLGYQVIEVQNQNGFTHVWCLVSTDEGQNWYHFDPTCWRWGSDGYLCMLTDEELTAYAYRHYVGRYTVSHDWDRQQLSLAINDYEEDEEARLYVLFSS